MPGWVALWRLYRNCLLGKGVDLTAPKRLRKLLQGTGAFGKIVTQQADTPIGFWPQGLFAARGVFERSNLILQFQRRYAADHRPIVVDAERSAATRDAAATPEHERETEGQGNYYGEGCPARPVSHTGSASHTVPLCARAQETSENLRGWRPFNNFTDTCILCKLVHACLYL